MAWDSFQIMLLLWAWLQCWLGICYNGYAIYSGNTNGEVLMPMAVLVVGTLMTNVLGVRYFCRKDMRLDACYAAVDLDSPYLAYKFGKQVVQGETCPDWEAMRLRSSTWRSLPLAMAGFALALRVVMEIPTCQACATVSIFATAAYNHELMTYSKFFQDLNEDGMNLTDITRFQSYTNMFNALPTRLKEDEEGLRVAVTAIHLENNLSIAANCADSKWHKETMSFRQAQQDSYVTPQYDATATFEDKSRLGGIGSGKLLAFNLLLGERLKEHLLKEESEKALRSALQRVSPKAAAGLRWVSWPQLVNRMIRYVHPPDYTMTQSITSGRPWTIGVGDHFRVELEDGWKVKLFQSFGLLLAAILPVRKRILQACQIDSQIPFDFLTFYIVLDTVGLTGVWLLSAMATFAYYIGQISNLTIKLLWPFILKSIEQAASQDEYARHFVDQMSEFLITNGVNLSDKIYENLLPAIAWDHNFFLPRVAGVLLFLGLSAGLSKIACPQGLVTCASVGVCGPLWLFTEEADGTENVKLMAEKNVEQFNATIKGIWYVMFFRTLFLAAAVGFSWFSVTSLSAQSFFALLCNNVFNVRILQTCCVAFFAGHLDSGYMAISVVCMVQESFEESEEQLVPYVLGSAGSSNDISVYGTFGQTDR